MSIVAIQSNRDGYGRLKSTLWDSWLSIEAESAAINGFNNTSESLSLFLIMFGDLPQAVYSNI